MVRCNNKGKWCIVTLWRTLPVRFLLGTRSPCALKDCWFSVLIDTLNPKNLISIYAISRIFRVDLVKEPEGYFLNNTQLLVLGWFLYVCDLLLFTRRVEFFGIFEYFMNIHIATPWRQRLTQFLIIFFLWTRMTVLIHSDYLIKLFLHWVFHISLLFQISRKMLILSLFILLKLFFIQN